MVQRETQPESGAGELVIVGGKGRVLQVRQTRRVRFDAAARKQFLDALAATCNVAQSARAVGVVVGTVYNRRRTDPAFADAWEVALSIGYDRLEEAMLAYAQRRFAVAEIDPDAAPDAAQAAARAPRIAAGEVSRTDLELALSLMNRQRPAGSGGRRAVTAQESNAAMRRRLDALAKQMGSK